MEAVDSFGPSSLIDVVDNDEELAFRLQLHEILVISIPKPPEWSFAAVGAGKQSERELICVVCARPVTPAYVPENATCAHAVCGSCLHWHIDKELQRNSSTVQCPIASCVAELEPEFYREFVSPKLFDRWMDVHQNGRGTEVPGETYDLNRKQVIEFTGSVIEIGESSGARQNDFAFFHCNICMESKPLAELFGIGSCLHTFCCSCISRHIIAKVEGNMTSIGCPEPGCKNGILEPEECREILPQAVFDKWGLALCESALGTKKFYCPHKDCSGLLIDEGGEVVTNAECPHCHRMFCATCKVPWHEGIDCERFQKLGHDERGSDDLAVRNMAIDRKWQRCPSCKMFVERTEGCRFMKCRCGYCFCYHCGSQMLSDSHTCQNYQLKW